MKILEDYLALYAQETPEKIAVVCNQQECSYAELYLRVCRRAEELEASLSALHSPLSSFAIPFRSTQSIDFLVEYMAIHKAGAAAAPLEQEPQDGPKGLS